ncbi:MAG: hypothetical protein IPO88_33095 [Nannocystis sp.]|uniref:hypothetical protein n=1 Tax=Nannocystis sp. TaxID=1962667 RepID=UPI002420F060|nr:hypothetical protein [Nannocystis sp.]MBK9758271.1 hypothetical protein [Nannocystis sp.]
MARNVLPRIILSSLLMGSFVLAAPGCKKSSGDSAALTPPAAPEYENPFAELNDLPNQINAQVDWVSQPLRDASALGDEFTAIQAKYSLDAKALGGLAKVAFTDGKVEITADVSIAAEAKGDVEALLGKIKAAGEAVLTIPKRATKAAGAISKLTLKVPALGGKATSWLKKEISAATGEAKASLEANLTAVPELTVKIKAVIPESVNKVKAIPAEAKTTITELTAAFAGDGAFPKLGTPPNAGGEAGAEGEAGADASAEGEAEASAEAPAA